jgi:hypothetical protein
MRESPHYFLELENLSGPTSFLIPPVYDTGQRQGNTTAMRKKSAQPRMSQSIGLVGECKGGEDKGLGVRD